MRRFGKFATVGALNTALTVAAFNLIVLTTTVSAPLANAVAYSLGIANSYYWNRRWTFRDRAHLPVGRTLPRFVLTNLVGLVLTTGVVAVLERVASASGAFEAAPRMLVLNAIEAVAILAGLTWNYLAAHRWAFAGDNGDGPGVS